MFGMFFYVWCCGLMSVNIVGLGLLCMDYLFCWFFDGLRFVVLMLLLFVVFFFV